MATKNIDGVELYTQAARRAARSLTEQYSSSFSKASRLFDVNIRDDIYAIYGLLRVADELVDSYGQEAAKDAGIQLKRLETEVYAAIKSGYSTNLLVHAFARTARRYGIERALLQPFFASMATDLRPVKFNQEQFRSYIHGSAEVVGLMCLRVFCDHQDELYDTLAPGAIVLGSAFQQVNFLRDLAADQTMGRRYFPQLQRGALNEARKQQIVTSIRKEFDVAVPYVERLPASARQAVWLSYRHYSTMLDKLESTPAEVIMQRRVQLTWLTKLRIWGQLRLDGQFVE